MAQGPVRKAAAGLLDHGRQADPQLSFLTKVDLSMQSEPPRRALDANFWIGADERHAFAIAREAVGRPLARGREVELVVSRARGLGDEQLAAGVLPELVGDARRARLRDAHAVEITLQPVRDLQA